MRPEALPVAVHDHAADNLRFIRDTIERTGSFTSIPGRGGVAIGLTAVITAFVASGWARSSPTLWLTIWLADAMVASVIALVTVRTKARAAGLSLTGRPARRFFLSYSAAPFAAVVLTVAEGMHGTYWLMPATWLLCYGAGFVSSGSFSIPLIHRLGFGYIALGVVAAFVSFPVGNIILGIGFGLLHIVAGSFIWRRYGG
jgi:hypothetical protein